MIFGFSTLVLTVHHKTLYNSIIMKGILPRIFGAAFIALFLVATSLTMVCAYHHGMEGAHQSSQETAHSTVICPSFAKIGGLTLLVASIPGFLNLNVTYPDIPEMAWQFDSWFIENQSARSPPLFTFLSS
jgi:hypothetical protein